MFRPSRRELRASARQQTKGDVEPDADPAGGVGEQPPAARVPRQHRAVADGFVRIGDQRLDVDLEASANALTRRAGTVGVERERLRTGVLEVDAKLRTDDLHPLVAMLGATMWPLGQRWAPSRHSGGWYDIALTTPDDTSFSYQLAGRLESRARLTSDPQLGPS